MFYSYKNNKAAGYNRVLNEHISIFLKLNLGLKNILIYCLKDLEQHLLNLEPQITTSKSRPRDGVAPQSLKELAMSVIGVK